MDFNKVWLYGMVLGGVCLRKSCRYIYQVFLLLAYNTNEYIFFREKQTYNLCNSNLIIQVLNNISQQFAYKWNCFDVKNI